jgi:hypothetical protein
LRNLLSLSILFLLGATPARAQTITGVSLPAPAEEFLLDLIRDAGLSSVRVTSFERTARRQAELMYGLLESVDIADVRDQYDSIGDSVVDYYELNRNRLPMEALIQGMEEVVSDGVRAMPDRQQMMHVLPTNNYTFDVAPSSVTPNEEAFTEAILNHSGFDLVSYILPGPAERAFHLEVSKDLETVSGRYSGVCPDPDLQTATPVEVILTRNDDGYGGTYTAYDQNLDLTEVVVDRKSREIVLETGAGEDVFAMTGTLDADHGAVNLRHGRNPDLTCRLGRERQ